MFCTKCGKELSDNGDICANCDGAVRNTIGNENSYAQASTYIVESNAPITNQKGSWGAKALFSFFGPVIGLFILVTVWGIIAILFAQSEFPEIVNILMPILILICVIAFPVGIFLGIYFMGKQRRATLTRYDSRSGNGYLSEIPEEIRGWNWGAFGLGIIWGLYHGVMQSLYLLIPIFNIIYPFVLGAKGSEYAWASKKWESIEAFKESRRKWNIAGIIILLINLIYFIGVFGWFIFLFSEIK